MTLLETHIEQTTYSTSSARFVRREHGNMPTNPDEEDRIHHAPVMVSETMEYLGVRSGGTYIDGTVGEGGHTLALLDLCSPQGTVLAIDRDPRALAVARQRFTRFGNRAILAHGSYAEMDRIAGQFSITSVSGVLLDLGFSSRQIEVDGYGLSFQSDEPLDMRYDPVGATAADYANRTQESELADLIYQFGEERRSRAIARAIVANRPVTTTGQLADVISRAVGGRRGGIHPATRTFQALRIVVNQELDQLTTGLDVITDLLEPGGRGVIISYHSLEDRIVKTWIDRATATCICPPAFPECVCNHVPTMRAVRRRVVRPSGQEIAGNPRSRSAKIRAVERI